MTIYFVAGGEGCDGVPGRGDIRVRKLGTLMMLGVRGPDEALSPLCETVRVGRGCDREIVDKCSATGFIPQNRPYTLFQSKRQCT